MHLQSPEGEFKTLLEHSRSSGLLSDLSCDFFFFFLREGRLKTFLMATVHHPVLDFRDTHTHTSLSLQEEVGDFSQKTQSFTAVVLNLLKAATL